MTSENTSLEDQALLESGRFSDVLVHCGDRTWKLHRSILCFRSAYFLGAFGSSFQESKDRELRIVDQNPEVVDVVLHWIYTKCLRDGALDRDDMGPYEAWVDLFRAADFFLVDSLRLHCMDGLSRELLERVISIQRAFCLHEVTADIMLPTDALQDVFDGVYLAYDSGLETMQEAFVDFVRKTHFWVTFDGTFRRLVREVPDFGTDIMLAVTDAAARGEAWPRQYPFQCSSCKQSP